MLNNGMGRGPGGSTARAAGQSRGRTEQGTAAQGGRGCDHGSERRCKVKPWSGVGLGAPDGGIKRRWKPLGLAQRFTAAGAGAGGGFLAPHSPGGDNLEAAPGGGLSLGRVPVGHVSRAVSLRNTGTEPLRRRRGTHTFTESTLRCANKASHRAAAPVGGKHGGREARRAAAHGVAQRWASIPCLTNRWRLQLHGALCPGEPSIPQCLCPPGKSMDLYAIGHRGPASGYPAQEANRPLAGRFVFLHRGIARVKHCLS